MVIKSRFRSLMKDAGIEDLYSECDVEKVNYIVGKDGKLYPTYDVDNTKNDSKDPSSR
nr:hypothetical protein [Wolbachia endosymbiont of Bemisia tabaci]